MNPRGAGMLKNLCESSSLGRQRRAMWQGSRVQSNVASLATLRGQLKDLCSALDENCDDKASSAESSQETAHQNGLSQNGLSQNGLSQNLYGVCVCVYIYIYVR